VKVERTALPGVVLVMPDVFPDDRGFFLESFNARAFAAAGLPTGFVQDNHSRSAAGVVRGLHYQLEHPQGKLVRVTRGDVMGVALDIRVGSPSFSRWATFELSDESHRMVWIPPGFAHGFCALTGGTDVVYKCTDFYAADDDHGVLWNDPDLAIPWPAAAARVSAKDAGYLPLRAPRSDLPVYQP
jgi:dTDP-4-dehydrorhamnose 3,5-epimerase